MRFSFVGRTEFLFETIRRLHGAGYELGGVVTARGESHYKRGEEDFQELSRTLGIPVLVTQRFDDHARNFLRGTQPDVVFSVNWPLLLTARDLDVASRGFVNAHAGDLPRYRGNACPNWAILNGEERLGVTLHLMEASSLDSGPILLKRYLPLTDDVYIGDCYTWLREEIPSMFEELASCLDEFLALRIDQRATGLSPLSCFPRRPSDSRICWTSPTAAILRLVRASSRPFTGATTDYEGETLTIWRAGRAELPYEFCAVPGSVLVRIDCGVVVATSDGALVIEEATFADGSDAIRRLGSRMRGRLV